MSHTAQPTAPGMTFSPESRRIIAGVGLSHARRKSRLPAFMDVTQSATGLVLALFLWAHMCFTSSILISKDAFWTLVQASGGYFITGRDMPWVHSVVVAIMLALVAVHAILALRKFPINYRQYRNFTGHYKLIRHGDTTLWWVQVVTGVALTALAFPHLLEMMMRPEEIGPYQSGLRVYESWLAVSLLFLVATEVHGAIGLYRICVKWGFFEGKNPDESRRRLKVGMWALIAILLTAGSLTLGAYYKLGSEVQYTPEAVYTPAWLRNPPQAEAPSWWPSWIKGAPQH